MEVLHKVRFLIKFIYKVLINTKLKEEQERRRKQEEEERKRREEESRRRVYHYEHQENKDTDNKDTDDKKDKVEKIIDKLTNPCAKGVFKVLNNEKLINTSAVNKKFGVSLSFSGEILDLFDKDKYTNYIIKNGNLPDEQAASTSGIRGNVVTTVSDSYLAKATRLSIAQTIIHELTHAYILYKLGKGVYVDFNKAIRLYAQKYGYKPSGTDEEVNRFHHEFMGQYVNAMAASLYLWDKNNSPTGGNLGWNYYYSMAFSGLFYYDKNGIQKQTNSWKRLVPNSLDRQNIINILTNEQEGNNYAKGTKCN